MCALSYVVGPPMYQVMRLLPFGVHACGLSILPRCSTFATRFTTDANTATRRYATNTKLDMARMAE